MSKRTVAIGAVAALVVIGLLVWTLPRGNKSNVTASLQPGVVTSAAPSPPDPLLQKLDEIVARHRKTIVLLEEGDSLPDADRERASLVGKIIFQENHQAIAALSNTLTDEIEKAGDFSKPLPQVTHFLDLVETQQDLHDADKLSFREVFSDLADSLSGNRTTTPAKAALESRIDDDRKALVEIQSLYEKELDKIFGRFETRGMQVRREAWERYVAYLRTKYRREDILKAYEPLVSRISASLKQNGKDNDTEIYGAKLPAKTFVLTFDDGPHVRYTDRILEVLKKYRVKSIFFELGSNLGSIKQNKVSQTRAASAARRLLEAGYVIGSHGFSHTLLPTMTDREVAVEIDETNRFMEALLNVRTPLFRPPYGGRDLKVLTAIEAHKMKSVMWNIDSKDWADPVAKSIANRVIRDARRYGRGIILLHDIHERTVDAVPLIVETLKNEGNRFLSWDGQNFVDDSPQITESDVKPPEPPPTLYHESWAVIIGIDNYPKWPKLHYAANDANGMKEILLRKFHFKPERVITLLNEEATREKILSVLGDTLANPKNVQRDDRVFVFFAGHGMTRKLPTGRDLGYIIPYDADAENFQGQSISMTNFQDISEAIPAKHVLFVMDSCYSGLALTRGQSTSNYIREVSKRTARQMLTAGGANEEVADNGPNGHSVFTWTVMQGLEGRADLNSDGYISAAELASYVAPGVSALSHQTPAFGNLPGSEGGEFVFELNTESELLSELSAQLDREAIQLNAELERVRKEVASKAARNQQLRDQLTAVKSQQVKAGPLPPPTRPPTTASGHLNKGDLLFKEQRYKEALDEYLAAAKLDAKNARAANDTGYVYYKMGNLDEALRWYLKTRTLDPHRAVVYANLGDLYYEMNKPDEAREAYEKFLDLAPNDRYAPTVRSRLGR